jgi:hypothetical protein
MQSAKRHVAKVTVRQQTRAQCMRIVKQCFRYSRVVVKSPSCQVFKSVLNTSLLIITSNINVDVPYVNNNAPYVGKSILYIVFHMMRNFAYIGIEELDILIVLFLILWIRKNSSTVSVEDR